MKFFIVRVDPVGRDIPDEDDGGEHDLPIWLIEAAMEDRLVVSVGKVRKAFRRHLADEYIGERLNAMVEVYLWWALYHPDTPLGLGWRPAVRMRPGKAPPRKAMTVIWHGDVYCRNPDGALAPMEMRDESWPTSDQWRVNTMKARHLLRSRQRARGEQP